jgi:hypothetical protein
MSTGAFETGKYEQNGGANIWPCKAQPETKGLTLGGTANAYPTDPITVGLPKIKLRKTRREFGLPIRTVTVELTADGTGVTADMETGSLHTIPVFQESVWAGYGEGQTGTYLGIACKFAGFSSGV